MVNRAAHLLSQGGSEGTNVGYFFSWLSGESCEVPEDKIDLEFSFGDANPHRLSQIYTPVN